MVLLCSGSCKDLRALLLPGALICGVLAAWHPLAEGLGWAKGLWGLLAAQHRRGRGFAPAQACSCWGHALPIAPRLPLREDSSPSPACAFDFGARASLGTTRCSLRLFSDNLRWSPRLPRPPPQLLAANFHPNQVRRVGCSALRPSS